MLRGLSKLQAVVASDRFLQYLDFKVPQYKCIARLWRLLWSSERGRASNWTCLDCCGPEEEGELDCSVSVLCHEADLSNDLWFFKRISMICTSCGSCYTRKETFCLLLSKSFAAIKDQWLDQKNFDISRWRGRWLASSMYWKRGRK